MIALATESVHSKMPVSHFIYSWRENEQPTAAQVDELVDIFLEHMGLTGHQIIYGLHFNTMKSVGTGKSRFVHKRIENFDI